MIQMDDTRFKVFKKECRWQQINGFLNPLLDILPYYFRPSCVQEIIVVDDGNEDHDVAAWLAQLHKVRVLRQASMHTQQQYYFATFMLLLLVTMHPLQEM